jgi:hypothetical protein
VNKSPLEILSDISVVDEVGNIKLVPIQETENNANIVCDKKDSLELPRMILQKTSSSKYTLYAWAVKHECINQIVEQVVMRFDYDGINDDAKLKLLAVIPNTKISGLLEFKFSLESV